MKNALAIWALGVLLPLSGFAQGVFWGNKAAPLHYFNGVVAKLIKAGASPKVEETKTEVKLVKAYYRGDLQPSGLAQPTEGGAEEAFIDGMKLTLKSKEFNKGFLQTEEYGDILILFDPNRLKCVFAMTPEQLAKLEKAREKKASPRSEAKQ